MFCRILDKLLYDLFSHLKVNKTKSKGYNNMAIYFDDQLVAGINSIDDSVLSNYVKFSDLFDDPSARIEEIKKTIAGLGLTLNNKDFYI